MVFKELSCSSKMYPDFEILPSTATLIFDLQQWNDIDDDSFKNEGQNDDDEDGSGTISTIGVEGPPRARDENLMIWRRKNNSPTIS